MNGVIFSQAIIILIGIAGLTGLLYLLLAIRKDHLRALDLVFLEIRIPKKDSKDDKDESEQFGSSKDFVKVIGVMSHLFTSLNAIRERQLFGSEYFTCEYSVLNGEIYFHLGIPRNAKVLIEKQVTSYYPEAVVEESPAPNIFTRGNKISCNYFLLKKSYCYPIRTISRI